MVKSDDRYFLTEEADGSLSICDRHVVEEKWDHRVVTGVRHDDAAELLEKLNGDKREPAK